MIDRQQGAEVWIGLADVRQRPGASMLMDRNEAVVNVVAMANTVLAFKQAIETALTDIGFDLIDLEDPEPLRVRQEQFEVSEELLRLAGDTRRDGIARFGDFHTWVSDEEGN